MRSPRTTVTAVLAAATLTVGAFAAGAAPVSAAQSEPAQSAECAAVLEMLSAEFGQVPVGEEDRVRYLEIDLELREISVPFDDLIRRMDQLRTAAGVELGVLTEAEAAVAAAEQTKTVAAAALTAAEAALAAALKTDPDGSEDVDEATAARDAARIADEEAAKALAAAQAARSAAAADLAATQAAIVEIEEALEPLFVRLEALRRELGVGGPAEFPSYGRFITLVRIAEAECEDTTGALPAPGNKPPVTKAPVAKAPVAKPVTARATFTG